MDTLICSAYTARRPIIPAQILTDGDSTVVAMMDPTATVMAKSKLDIFEKLRFPKIRVSRITLRYIPVAFITIIIYSITDFWSGTNIGAAT
jgi:hypothetical protein